MSAKKKVQAEMEISPVLFFTDEGVPMQFYVRPGPSKQKLRPLIIAGGGLLSNTQLPNTILLLDPEERDSIPKTASNWYVSTHFVYDCVEKEAQLYLEDYRLNSEENKPSTSSTSVYSTPQGRMRYTSEEDAAISEYVQQFKGVKTRGNRIWQQMEKDNLTSHTWQSMKDRYIRHISKQLKYELKKMPTKGGHAAENEEMGKEVEATKVTDMTPDAETATIYTLKLSSDEEEDSDGTQIDVSANEKPSINEASQKSISLLTPEAAEVSEERVLCNPDEPQDNPARSADAAEPGSEPSQSLLEVRRVTPTPEPSPCSSTPTKRVVKPLRRSSRRRLGMDATPPEAKRKKPLSSDSETSPRTDVGSPKNSTPIKPRPTEQSPEKHTGESPSIETEALGKDRGPDQESQQENDPAPHTKEQTKGPEKLGIIQLAALEFQESDTESMEEDAVTEPRREVAVTEPRREVAAIEPRQEVAAIEPRQEVAAIEPRQEVAAIEPRQEVAAIEPRQEVAAIEPRQEVAAIEPRQEVAAIEPRQEVAAIEPRQEVATIEPRQEVAAIEPRQEVAAIEPRPEVAAIEPRQEVAVIEPRQEVDVIQPPPIERPTTSTDQAGTHPDPKPGPTHQEDSTLCGPPTRPETSAAIEPVLATSKAHLFIFETQVENSQANGPSNAADPEQNLDEALVLTQVQLDEDIERIRELMKVSGRDLVSVTKALLQTSGDFPAALGLLSVSCTLAQPFWTRTDDRFLLSADPEARNKLREKYGEQRVAKRMLFLEVEG